MYMYVPCIPTCMYLESLDHAFLRLHGEGEAVHEATRQHARIEPLKYILVVYVAKHCDLRLREEEGRDEWIYM